MFENRRVVRVFLASPGDLSLERSAAKQVVDEMNQLWFAYHGYHVELVGWELTVAGFGRPQALINQDLNKCEYFLGMLHKRWGTPPDKSGEYTSGFEEEFRQSLQRCRATEKPDIAIFFKSIDEQDLLDPGEQLKQVLSFKKEIIESKNLYFEEFTGLIDFQDKVRRTLTRYIQTLMAAESQSESVSHPGSENALIPESVSTDVTGRLISNDGAKFLQKFIITAAQDYLANGIAIEDLARFRLFGSILGSEKSDPLILGAHDANALYFRRKSSNMSEREYGGLVDAGLADYGDENKPLWYWHTSLSNEGVLAFRSISAATEDIKIGALHAMRNIAEPLPKAQDYDRSLFLNSWFDDLSPSPRRAAALKYLAICGAVEDLPVIKKELDRNDYQTSNIAVDALLRINLRVSRERAYEALLELQPERVAEDILRVMLVAGSGIQLDTLREGLGHRSQQVRSRVVKYLIANQEFDIATAEMLLSDESRDVRLDVMLFLSSRGRLIWQAEARELLVIPKPTGAFITSADGVDEDRFHQFMYAQLAMKSDADLEKLANDSVFDRDAEFILAGRRPKKHGSALRSAVQNLFELEFSQTLKAMNFQDADLIKK